MTRSENPKTFTRRLGVRSKALKASVGSSFASNHAMQHQTQAADRTVGSRAAMVHEQLRARGIRDPRVLEAMSEVPRHVFVPAALAGLAYADSPLPIGYGQTISQPYIVALMTEALELGPRSVVLDVGTGCGYQAAVLAHIVRRVVSVEIVAALALSARARLAALGIRNVEVVAGDGSQGWAPGAPYDGIVVAAACPRVPRALVDQLAEGGRLVAPVGSRVVQTLVRMVRLEGRTTQESLGGCQFVPLTGSAGWWGAAV